MSNQPELRIELSLKDRIIKTYTFAQPSVVVGRDPDADIVIDNTGISRYHMKIDLNEGGTYVVKDMGSTNGIFLNGQQVHEEPLRNNDVVTLSKFVLKVGIEKSDALRRAKQKSGGPPDDIDGTTVLSKEQMAQMMANVQKEQVKKAAGPAGQASAPAAKGMPVGLLALGGIIVLIILGAVGYFVLR